MKIVSAVLLTVFLSLPLCQGQTKAPIRISVDREQKTKEKITQHGNSQQSGNWITYTPEVKDRSREMVLNIKIQNLGANVMTDLVVKYTIFGRDRQTRAIRPAGQGEETVTIKPVETKLVRTDPVDFESKDVTFTTGGHFGNMNRSSGSEYYGIAVTVFVGSDKVATFLNPTTLDKQLEKLEKEQTGKSEK